MSIAAAGRRLLPVGSPEGQHSVEAAEGEGIGERVFDSGRAGDVGDDVEITTGIGLSEIDGGGDEAVREREHGGDCFQRSRGAERVAMH